MSGAKVRSSRWIDFARLRRLTLKELRETLRDRRTIVTLVMMPMLVYPVLSLVFRTFLISGAISAPVEESVRYRFAVQYETTAENFELFIAMLASDGAAVDPQSQDPSQSSGPDSGDAPTADVEPDPRPTPFIEHDWLDSNGETSLQDLVAQNEVDLGLKLNIPDSFAQNPNQRVQVDLVVNEKNARSVAARDYFLEYLQRSEDRWLRRARIPKRFPFTIEKTESESEDSSIVKPQSRVSLATLVPLILVLMTITGAVYPAIDLTAGERERGTLESLIAAPIPRMRILIAKFVAVVTVAMLTATLNVIGMLVTVWAFQLETVVFGPLGFTAATIIQIFLLLLLFAGFFSAVLLVVTSFARSFKEAQAYLVPIILFSMTPGVMSLLPGMTLDGPLAVVPMVNFVLLSRDLLQGQASLAPAILVVVSTILYSVMAIAIAARIFGTDAILYGSQQSWGDSLRRPNDRRQAASPLTAILCLTLLFPANFVAISVMGRFAESVPIQLAIMVTMTTFFFIVVPLIIAWHQRIGIRPGFAFRHFGVGALVAVILLGISLWPMVAAAVSQSQEVIAYFKGQDAADQWYQRLIEVGQEHVERWRKIPAPLLIFCFSVVPAVAEEWFFRGFLMQALMKRNRAWKAILWSSVAFGLFHILSQSVVALDRFLPTMVIGIFLGIVCWRTRSVIPGMILHTLHNGIVVGLAYYNESLREVRWLPFAEEQLPLWFVATAALIAACGLVLLYSSTKKQKQESIPEEILASD